MDRKVRVALIGAGAMGRGYAKMIVGGRVEHMMLAGVVARRPEIREWAETLVDANGVSPKVYESTEELFADSAEYDAVLVVTPHKSHCEFACRAFALGKHVMCDKPAGVTVSEARKMADCAKENNRIYGVMFHQHKYPKYEKLKSILDSGELGQLSRIMLVNSGYFRTKHYHQSGSWRSSWNGEGGGALINQGAHILDMWQWLFGMPDRIYADIPFGKYNEFQVDDEATLLMHYDNDMTAVFMLTTGEAVKEERLDIVGSKGRLLLQDNTIHIWKYHCDVRDYMAEEPVNSRENLSVTEEVIVCEKEKEPYTEMLEEFALAVIHNRPKSLTAPGAEAVNQVMLTNAAYLSAWKKQAILLPIDDEEYDKAYEEQCESERQK